MGCRARAKPRPLGVRSFTASCIILPSTWIAPPPPYSTVNRTLYRGDTKHMADLLWPV